LHAPNRKRHGVFDDERHTLDIPRELMETNESEARNGIGGIGRFLDQWQVADLEAPMKVAEEKWERDTPPSLGDSGDILERVRFGSEHMW
jgi:hypothetical protein